MISRLEQWYKDGYWSGNCSVDSVSFCEYVNWEGVSVVDITGHTCCATDKLLIDTSNGCAWYCANLSRTIVHALLGKSPEFITTYFCEENYRLFWDYKHKKEELWDRVSEWDVPIDISVRKIKTIKQTSIGKFSDFMRR
jgi:hypothetical protein